MAGSASMPRIGATPSAPAPTPTMAGSAIRDAPAKSQFRPPEFVAAVSAVPRPAAPAMGAAAMRPLAESVTASAG